VDHFTEETSSPDNKANFILRLWRGDVPLWKTYWIYGSVVGAILGVSIRLLLYRYYYYYLEDLSTFDRYAISYLLFAVIILYSLLIFVGVWRSANKYRKSYPQKRGYAALAQTAVVFGALGTVGSFVRGFTDKNESIDAIRKSGTPDQRLQLDATIAGLNKDLPKMIDSVTRLNKIDVSDQGLVYFETITVKLDSPDVIQTGVKPSIIRGVCGQADTLSILKDGFSFHYVYSDSDGKALGDVVITKADCPT
jgi:hypothetical protein